ncbi:hypothetical protein ACN47E_006336 [Coniothyrium glycines]
MALASPILSLVLRGFQFVFGIIVLGLSVTLIRGHHWGSTPASLIFGAFVGGVSVLGALVGLAATWISLLEGVVGLAVDGLVALVNVAGGVYFAIRLGGVQCKIDASAANNQKVLDNDWFNGGCLKFDGTKGCWVLAEYGDNAKKAVNILLGHCREAQANTVFMFLTAVVFLVSGTLLFLRSKRSY